MSFTRARLTGLVVAGLGLLAVADAPADAGSVSTNLSISAVVTASCSVTATPLAFGGYTPTAVATTTATVAVTCLNGTVATIGLNPGLNGAAGGVSRSMANGASKLGYEIYQDSGHAAVWGASGAAAETFTSTGATQNLTAFGQIPAGQPVAIGSYSDTVTVTVTF
jgi:spore coat protein U-like protein